MTINIVPLQNPQSPFPVFRNLLRRTERMGVEYSDELQTSSTISDIQAAMRRARKPVWAVFVVADIPGAELMLNVFKYVSVCPGDVDNEARLGAIGQAPVPVDEACQPVFEPCIHVNSVTRDFPRFNTRVTPWTHHRAVAALPAPERQEKLEKALAEGLSSRAMMGSPEPRERHSCPDCGQEHQVKA